MKTTAYVINKNTGEYKLDDKGDFLSVRIGDALRIRDSNKSYRKQDHEQRIYMTRNPNPERRVVLLPRGSKSPHYKFENGVSSTGDKSYDETFSHESAVDALSSMKEISISVNGKHYRFKFTSVHREQLLKLPNGKSFYPDVFCTFDKENHPKEYDMWGGKLAIEVTNTHECEKDKLFEFEQCNIPIFEFKIGDSRTYPPERDSKREDTTQERNRHENNLQKWMSEEVWMNLILDPVSTTLHDIECKQLNREINVLKEKEQVNESLEYNLDRMTNEVRGLTKELSNRDDFISIQKESILKLNGKYNDKAKSASLWFLVSIILFVFFASSVIFFKELTFMVKNILSLII